MLVSNIRAQKGGMGANTLEVIFKFAKAVPLGLALFRSFEIDSRAARRSKEPPTTASPSRLARPEAETATAAVATAIAAENVDDLIIIQESRR
jgi:hypothetical protein